MCWDLQLGLTASMCWDLQLGLTASMCWDSQQAIWCDVVLAGIGDQDTEEHCQERGLHQIEACVCTEGVCPQVSSESNKIKLYIVFMTSISRPQMGLSCQSKHGT